MKDTRPQGTVLWSAQADSRRCASCSTGSVRHRDQIITPAIAPQMAPAAHMNFFIRALLLTESLDVKDAQIVSRYAAGGTGT